MLVFFVAHVGGMMAGRRLQGSGPVVDEGPSPDGQDLMLEDPVAVEDPPSGPVDDLHEDLGNSTQASGTRVDVVEAEAADPDGDGLVARP
jgi:hypothetical protein